MNPELQEQINKIQNFNENESKKVIELKKLFSSKLFLVLIIASISLTLLLFITNLVNQVLLSETINFQVVISLIGDGILNLLFPLVFLFFIITLYKKSSIEKLGAKEGVVSKLFTFRSFVKFFFIITIIGNISNGITFLQIESLQQISPELYASMVTSETDLQMYKVLGMYYLIQTGFATCTWFALARFTKYLLQSIIFDTKSPKLNDAYAFLIIFIAQGLVELIGIILSLSGITNPLTGIYFVPPIIFPDILLLIYYICYFIFVLFVAYLFIKIIKIIKNTSGTTNPLRDENSVVYTIKLDEEGEN